MNKNEFINLSLNPNSISIVDTIAIETVLESYPYFQTAQMLQLKGLKLQHSFKYNKALKKVAAYTANRTVLFDFITTDVLDLDQKNIKEKETLEEIEVIDSKLIEHINQSIDTQKEVVTDDFNQPVESDILEERRKLKVEAEKSLQIGKPIQFEKNDEFSFNEWLDLPPKQQVEREETLEKDKINEKYKISKLSKQVSLIENFIIKKPKIKPLKSQEIKNVAIDSVKENTNLMTETLARVYVEQKKYDKAILAFEILSLKYPEKSSFFASKIKAIKILQKQ